MKKHFPGHFSPTKSEIKLLWENCIFVVDTNILLNLYRYSDATRKEFLQILDKIKERLWLGFRLRFGWIHGIFDTIISNDLSR